MRSLLLGAAVAAAPLPASAQACAGEHAPGTVRLTVLATAVRNAQGQVAFTLYPDDSRRFLAHGGKLARVRTQAVAGTTGACFWVRPGFYAVANYHDENGDRDFNRTLFTIKEGFGVSNDPPTTFGIPRFAAARFGVGANGGTIRVRMRYSR
jgi:uncharacterized protein (DUF2141 family)